MLVLVKLAIVILYIIYGVYFNRIIIIVIIAIIIIIIITIIAYTHHKVRSLQVKYPLVFIHPNLRNSL